MSIFLNYRRDDSQWVAGRLYDALVQAFPEREIYRDIDSIEPGVDFTQVIEQTLESVDVVLVLIGNDWLESLDNNGRRRLEDSSDWVRQEIATGLRRGILVVPVLIEGTEMPRPEELPEDLQALTRRNALHLSDRHFQPELHKLVNRLQRHFDELPSPQPVPSGRDVPIAEKPWSSTGLRLAVVAVSFAILIGTLIWLSGTDPSGPKTEPDLTNSIIVHGTEMRLVPGGIVRTGTESMSDAEDNPIREAQISPFYMDMFEVTNGEFARFVAENPGHALPTIPAECPREVNYPVCGVPWHSAQAYCEWAGKQLPSEAQWETAARGTDGRGYPWGNEPVDGDRANYCDSRCEDAVLRDVNNDDVYARAAPVDTYSNGRSPYGIYNLAGNVWEWTRDWYDPGFYTVDEKRDPVSTNRRDEFGRVVRGGSWISDASHLRAYYRTWRDPEQPRDYVGFRCVLEADSVP